MYTFENTCRIQIDAQAGGELIAGEPGHPEGHRPGQQDRHRRPGCRCAGLAGAAAQARPYGPGLQDLSACCSRIVLGAAVRGRDLPRLSWLEACIFAAILAPTDAGLGQIIVNSRSCAAAHPRDAERRGWPERRPVGAFSAAVHPCLGGATQADARGQAAGALLGEQLGWGVLIGVAVGGVGGWLLGQAHRKDWMAPQLAQLAVVALPLLCVLAADGVAASMPSLPLSLPACWRSGVSRAWAGTALNSPRTGASSSAMRCSFCSAWSLARNGAPSRQCCCCMAPLSLTLVRMLPVALALLGTRLTRASVLFIGWFGPRGLASIVLGLVYLEHEARLPGEETIRLAVIVTVLASIYAHGLSTRPGIAAYAHRSARLGTGAAEHEGSGAEPARRRAVLARPSSRAAAGPSGRTGRSAACRSSWPCGCSGRRTR